MKKYLMKHMNIINFVLKYLSIVDIASEILKTSELL